MDAGRPPYCRPARWALAVVHTACGSHGSSSRYGSSMGVLLIIIHTCGHRRRNERGHGGHGPLTFRPKLFLKSFPLFLNTSKTPCLAMNERARKR